MIELTVRTLIDMGINRKKAVILVTIGAFIIGIPSATNLTFFQNQDWVWALGLMLSGLFVSMLVSKYGNKKFRTDFLHPNDFKSQIAARLFDIWLRFGIPVLFVIVIGWWFKQSYGWNPKHWLNPLEPFSVGTVLLQWGIMICIFLVLNKFLVKKSQH